MKAVEYKKFGPPSVLEITELEKPAPEHNEVLVNVKASQVNYGDVTARNFANIPVSKFNMPMLLWLPVRIAFGLW